MSNQEGLSVQKTQQDFGEWYSQILTKGDMIDYYDVSGCYVLKPASFAIWEAIQDFFNARIKKDGVKNTYFPLFVSSRVLEREKDHIEGFAPEVAWVTRAGKSNLEEPVAIRPTSETVMYPYYAKWIQSHRDLPLRYNQWNSVVRWEFKNPQPFLRTREFLWQEGHTAFLTKKEADDEVMKILNFYREIYEDLLAVPVIPGKKTENEKFAGADYTFTVEGYIPTTGRGIQGATSHSLGQNFSKMFNIVVEDPAPVEEGKTPEKVAVWQNSWGFSTRSIGVSVMLHSDDKGLVIPPRAAETQVVVIPVGITKKTTDGERTQIFDKVDSIVQQLNDAGIRATSDTRNHTPGYKFNEAELKGIPLRLELGPKDLAKAQALSVLRHNGDKASLSLATLPDDVKARLDSMHTDLFNKAKAEFDAHIKTVTKWEDVVPALNDRNILAIPWCFDNDCEDQIKDRSAEESKSEIQDERAPSAGAKSLCIPFDQDRFGKLPDGAKCPNCGRESKQWVLFGRSY